MSEQDLCPIAKMSAKTPKALAIASNERSLTYEELDSKVQGVQARLRRIGISFATPCRFEATRSIETIALLFALFREEVPAFPCNPKAPTEKTLFDPSQLASVQPLHTMPPLIPLQTNALFLHTSGTSGTPKVAALSLKSCILSAQIAAPHLHLQFRDRYLLSLPLYHVGGLGILFRCFTQGATCVLSPLPLSEALLSQGITHASLVPTQLYSLLEEAPFFSPPTLKTLLLGGAPIAQELQEGALERGFCIKSCYGMTETASLIALDGAILEEREVKLLSDGEVAVRGSTLFSGYVNEEGSIEPATTCDGWFATKDVGKLKEGRLTILGRKDTLFFSGGENIYPEEIERALCSIHGIEEAVVVPKPDPKWGARPIAFIRTKKGVDLTLSEVRDQLECTLAHYKHPVALLPFPENPGLKLSRCHLKNQVLQGAP